MKIEPPNVYCPECREKVDWSRLFEPDYLVGWCDCYGATWRYYPSGRLVLEDGYGVKHEIDCRKTKEMVKAKHAIKE